MQTQTRAQQRKQQQHQREQVRKASKDPSGGDKPTMEVVGDEADPDTPSARSTTTVGTRGSLGVQAIFAAGLDRTPEEFLDPSQNFMLKINNSTGEWTIEFRLDEDMDPAPPPGCCGLVATRTLTDRAQHGKPYGVIDVMREVRKLNQNSGALC
jgi:hypothetical protein